ncbi:hypothetical protein [Marinicrinis lubricantis]|uniref:Uncharacterized protein n=1 Tax=Marinicrinis lubricantis TaxID=2086470 RepID=A0ABW1IIN8_9BACL
MSRQGKTWNYIGMIAVVAMGLYALPKLRVGEGASLPTLFAIAWLAFALIILAAHLHRLLHVDEAKQKELARIRRMRKWQQQQWMTGQKRKMM